MEDLKVSEDGDDPETAVETPLPADPTNENHVRDLASPQPGRTILPGPLARAVSFATRSTALAIRVGTFVGGYGLDAAKFTTLSSLELGRGILGGILSRAGSDVISQSSSELSRADAETVLERSLENLHRTMTHIVFWTTTGFRVTSTAFSMVSEVSQLLLSSLDQFFGSTDSSRAIASIITLIRREFQNPATGVQGEKVGVTDLILGLCGLAYLQQWCRRLIEQECRRLEVEAIVWDVVVLNDGERVDVHNDSLYGVHSGRYNLPAVEGGLGIFDPSTGRDLITTIENHGSRERSSDSDQGEDDDLPEINLKRQIMRSLPSGANVSISTSVSTTKTITVDITGKKPLSLSPPPGVEIVEEGRISPPRSLPTSPQLHSRNMDENMTPTYRVVYRVNRETFRSTSVQGDTSHGGENRSDDISRVVEQIDDHSEDDDTTKDEHFISNHPPPVPPKHSSDEHSRDLNTPRSSGSSPRGTTANFPAPLGRSQLPVRTQASETAANQKRPRMPLTSSSSSNTNSVLRKHSLNKIITTSNRDEDQTTSKPTAEKKGGFRSALRKGPGPALSNLLHKDPSGSETSLPGSKAKSPRGDSASSVAKGRTKTTHTASSNEPSHLQVPNRTSSMIPKRDPPPPPRGPTVGQFRRATPGYGVEEPFPRNSSRASYVSIHERRRDSIISQTDTFSVHSTDTYRPVSPTVVRTEVRSGSSMAKSRSEKDMADQKQTSPLRNHHRRVKSQVYTPSIFTINTNESQTSLILSPYHRRSAFGDGDALVQLRRTGTVSGMFPNSHLLSNISRFMRFSSASYGSNFLRVLGISKAMQPIPSATIDNDTHHELRSFAHHTESDASSILLCSFVDPQGGSDSSGSTGTGVPLVHYISLDHASRAVVLACRGTLGFEDVLADMTCDYDDLAWRGRRYKVHKGVHASARRLLYGGDGRVLATLRTALEEFEGYGLVLCGHSLGGAVTALLGVMLAEPDPLSTSFVTSSEPLHGNRMLTNGEQPRYDPAQPAQHLCLPPGRPIHVFAYGPPATMSPSLRRATRGLITSVVHGNDLVPYLSLGVLHDLQAVALAFKTDNHAAKVEVRQRIWEAFQTGLADKWYAGNAAANSGTDAKGSRGADDQWAYAALKTLRASMMSEKLLPPGEVFVVETTAVLRRDAFVLRPSGAIESTGEGQHLGAPAKRVVLKYVRDVETRFREVRFGTRMLTDHSPAKYEDALEKLRLGVLDS